jgi:hypothetical protein
MLISHGQGPRPVVMKKTPKSPGYLILGHVNILMTKVHKDYGYFEYSYDKR